MTIRETVKQALTLMSGNKPFTIREFALNEYRDDCNVLTDDQLKRALRSISYVKRLTDGRYVVKGRKVPPKVDITTS